MIIDTPPPPRADTKSKTPLNAITERTWVPAAAVVGIVIAALTIHGTWRNTDGRVDLQAVEIQALKRQMEDVRAVQERHSQTLASQARTTELSMLGLQRDVSEMRAAVERIEEAIAPTQGRARR